MDEIKKKGNWALMFDGASKGNLGEEGGGGVLIDPDGKTRHKYPWGIGRAKNNIAEASGLWLGITLAKEKYLRHF